MKLILMGSSGFSVPVFNSLRGKHEILCVYTREPKPSGRGRKLTPTPVAAWANDFGIPIKTDIKEFDNEDADFVIVMTYGVIIPDEILAKGHFLNIHPSDLPKYRGPSPIPTTIRHGDTKSAVCLIDVAHEVDSGDVYLRKPFDISFTDTTSSVEQKVSNLAIEILDEFLDNPKAFKAIPQEGIPSITKRLKPEDFIIDWNKQPVEIYNQIRAYGYGKTEIYGVPVKVLKVEINPEGTIKIIELRPDGRSSMTWDDFQRGYSV